jgi:hypothetical protein
MPERLSGRAPRLRVTEAIVIQLSRQGVAETLAGLGFDTTPLAKVVIKAADGDVIDLTSRRDAR